jgi:RNA polymerase sigma factor (sigma-70 family)
MDKPPGRVSEQASAEVVESFEDFFEAHHRRLFGTLCLVTGDKSEAEELMQEAFLSMWERWDRVRRLDDPVGYLFRTAFNRFRSRARRVARAASKGLRHRPEPDAFASIEERQTLLDALRSLTPRQRAALVLTELFGYSSEEAGIVLRVKAGTVRALAFQARAALRKTLEAPDE